LSEVLDAAHIKPYSIDKNNESTNGLLLRAGIHNLFDDGLIKIDYQTFKVKIDKQLKNTEYKKYQNRKIKDRKDGFKPDREALKWHNDNT